MKLHINFLHSYTAANNRWLVDAKRSNLSEALWITLTLFLTTSIEAVSRTHQDRCLGSVYSNDAPFTGQSSLAVLPLHRRLQH